MAESNKWWVKYHQAQQIKASQSVYAALKGVSKTLSRGLSDANYSAMEDIRANNICLSSSELSELRKVLDDCVVKYVDGDYDNNIVIRGILSGPMSGILNDFDNAVTQCLTSAAERHQQTKERDREQETPGCIRA